MKILLIAPQPFFEKRGTPLAVLQLIKALSELDHNVDLLTYHLGEAVSVKGVTHYRTTNLPFIKRVKKGQSAAKILIDVFLFFKAMCMLLSKRYDCIHAVEEAAIMGVLFKKLFRIPLIYDMDSSIPEQLEDSESLIWASPLVVNVAKFFEKRTVSASDLVLAVCKSLGDRVQKTCPGKDTVILEDIPNVEPLDPTMASSVVKLKKELVGEVKHVVLYTGTFESYQGVDLLLEAVPYVISSVPDVKFILVGGEDAQVIEKIDLVSKLDMNKNILILGKRPLEEMPLFMEMSDVLISPRSKGTNTPMKIYTYLQSGRPVVATNLLTHTQVLTDKTSMLVEPEPKAFAEGIVTLLRDEALREALGSAGQRLVEENYSYKKFVEKVEAAYARIKV